MSSSTSKRPRGILFDTNVLSLFARIERLDILLQVFSGSHQAKQLYVSPIIQQELELGIQHGAAHLAKAMQLIATDDIRVLQPVKADQQFIAGLPAKLGAGEAEAIALCHRLNLVFISHDRKAVNYCKRVDIPSVRFSLLLKRLHTANILTELEIEQMLS